MVRRFLLALTTAAVVSLTACNIGQADPDWAQTAADDLRFIRDTLGANHPGPVDDENTWFREWFERGHTEALALAERAENYAGYYFAIQYYMQGFQDGHLGALGDNRLGDERIRRRWPGFLVGMHDGRFVVVEGGDAAAPAAGAVLLGCDGQSPEQLAEERLQSYVGLWSVRGIRPRLAPFLLVDEGNPFVERLSRCRFESAPGSEPVAVQLDWQPISNEDLAARIDAVRQHVVPPIGLRRFGPDGYWITLSSFNASNDAVDGAIQELSERLESEVDQVRDAAVLVFDVRGNRGGNSSYGTLIASTIWGKPYIDSTRPRSEGVDWRLSEGNVRFMREFNLKRSRERFGEDAPVVRWMERLVGDMEAALARGDTFLREANEAPAPSSALNPVSARVFLLTDSYCASACLDFADLVLAIEGVTHIGRETSADAIYIDNRAVRLPSGHGSLGFSMKVYRGRPRGHNESYFPRHEWTGRMDETAALGEWVLELAGSG